MKKTKDFAEQADQEENEFTEQDSSPETYNIFKFLKCFLQ